MSSGVVAIAAAGLCACALTTTGAVLCWGGNWYGEVGDGTTQDTATPVAVTGLPSPVSSVAAGEAHSCALISGRDIACWGSGHGLAPTPVSGFWGNDRPPAFTDDPLLPGVSTIEAVHVFELSERVGDLRTRYALTPYAWTDLTLSVGVTAVKSVHIEELRQALNELYGAAGRTPPPYEDEPGTGGATLVKGVHIAQVRNAIVAVW